MPSCPDESDVHRHAARGGGPINPSNKRGLLASWLGSLSADADDAALASNTLDAGTDVDIVIARGKIKAGCFAQSNVT